LIQLGPSSCPGRTAVPLLPASTLLPVPLLPASTLLPPVPFLVHLVWILCQDLIRRWYLVTYELIRCDTVSLFYHSNTLSHSADSGAPISPAYCLASRLTGAGPAAPGGGSGCPGRGVSPSKNKSHTRFFSAKFFRLNPFGQAQPLKPSIYQRISAFLDKPRN
jgi:hypothetical protein